MFLTRAQMDAKIDEGRMRRENVWIDLASILQQLPQ